MRILITGGTGFIGRTLVPFLYSKRKYEIALMVRNTEKADEMFPGIDLYLIDTNINNWRNKVIDYNPEVTLHMAAFYSNGDNVEHATKIVNSNILYTTLLLEALAATSCTHFINLGTFVEYYLGTGQFFPNTLYAASKTAARSIIQYYQLQSTWNWVNIVLYSAYGRKNENKKVIDYMIDAIDSSQVVGFTKGEQILDFIHVDDICSFFERVFDMKANLREKFAEFHLGTGVGYSIREVASTIESVSGKKMNAKWGEIPYKKYEAFHAVAPITSNIKILNWKSCISLQEGIKILIDEQNGR